MAEDMIERVAKRLWDHSFDRMPDPPWEQTSELQRRFNRMLAGEAIKEIGAALMSSGKQGTES